MRTVYYYASQQMQQFSEPQNDQLADCQLTQEMLRFVVAECATGTPPFKAFIPRFIAWQYCSWEIPKMLLMVQFIEGKPASDISPHDTARIIFDDCTVEIICRRVIPVTYEVFS